MDLCIRSVSYTHLDVYKRQTPKNINDLKLQKAHEEKVAQEILAEAKAFAEELKDKKVVLSVKVGEGGKVFGSISSKEIQEAAKARCV